MTDETASRIDPLLGLTTIIVSAYAWGKSIPVSELTTLIGEVHAALKGAGERPAAQAEKPPEAPTPAVPIKRSILPDFIICLEDGKKFKSLKRHLHAQFGMTPEEYRTKWGLPSDYPMVAPNYAAARSALAKTMGLGQRRSAGASAATRKGRRKSAG